VIFSREISWKAMAGEINLPAPLQSAIADNKKKRAQV
jgi:hypothetical protein